MKRFYKITLYANVIYYRNDGTTYHRWNNWGIEYFSNRREALKKFKLYNNLYQYKAVLRMTKKKGGRKWVKEIASIKL